MPSHGTYWTSCGVLPRDALAPISRIGMACQEILFPTQGWSPSQGKIWSGYLRRRRPRVLKTLLTQPPRGMDAPA
jgi:hypothetical protein